MPAVPCVTFRIASARASDAGGTTMASVKSAIDADVSRAHLSVCRIGPQDLRDAVAKGLELLPEYINKNLYYRKSVLPLALKISGNRTAFIY
jgi:hypothetical protein